MMYNITKYIQKTSNKIRALLRLLYLLIEYIVFVKAEIVCVCVCVCVCACGGRCVCNKDRKYL